MRKAVGIAALLVLAAGLGALLYVAGAFDTNTELSGHAVAKRETPPPAPVAEAPRPGRLQIFIADSQTKDPIPEFEMRREPAPSANWLENRSSDGRFELSGLMDRHMRLRFRADGYFPNHVDLLYAKVPQDEVMKAFSLLLEPGYEVRGTVLDAASGAAIAGAHIRALPSLDVAFEDYAPADPAEPVTLSDAEGIFSLSVSPPSAGRYLAVWAADHAVTVFEHDAEAGDKALELRLGPGGHKKFVLVQESGGVGPMRFRLDQPQADMTTHPLPLEAVSAPGAPAELRFVPKGVYRAILNVPGGTEWGRATVAVGAGVQVTETWDVDQFGGIFGTVKDYRPDFNIVVSIVDARYPYVPIFETAPDAGGLFEFGFLPPGPYIVRVAYAESDVAPEEKKYNVVNGEWREIEVSRPPVLPPLENAPGGDESP